MRKSVLIVAILLSAIAGLFAQSQITTSGGEASGGGGTVSYTVGQISNKSYSTSSGTVAEGVQQAFEISITTEIEHTPIGLVQVMAYPNPVTEYLKLLVDVKNIEGLSYQLFDMQGKLLQNRKLTDSETKINMSNHIPSTYFIKVVRKNQPIKKFKIIKTQ